jgi:hypothetical protein
MKTLTNLAKKVGLAIAALVLAVPASAQLYQSGDPAALGALNATAAVYLQNAQSASVTLAVGTLAGTITPEISFDGGTTYLATFFESPTTGQVVQTMAFTNPNSATSLIIFGSPGATNVRVRVSLYTSGTATATVRAAQQPWAKTPWFPNYGARVASGSAIHTPGVSTQATKTIATADTGTAALTINVAASAGTFTRTTGDFLANGFLPGQTILTSGFTAGGDNTTKVISTVTTTIITVTSITGLVDETGNNNERVIGSTTGVRHVADCISYSGGATTAPAATALTVDLRDSMTAAGTILWQARVVAPASTGTTIPANTLCGLNIRGALSAPMTLEFSALLTNLFESVTVVWYDVLG